MKGKILCKKVTLKPFIPTTYGRNDKERKKDLAKKIRKKIKDFSKVKKACRGKRLYLDVCFYLLGNTTEEGRKTKDLDNLLKIFCDSLPDYVDKARTEKGLRLIKGNDDHMIYEINCSKELVEDDKDEGIVFKIYEYKD